MKLGVLFCLILAVECQTFARQPDKDLGNWHINGITAGLLLDRDLKPLYTLEKIGPSIVVGYSAALVERHLIPQEEIRVVSINGKIQELSGFHLSNTMRADARLMKNDSLDFARALLDSLQVHPDDDGRSLKFASGRQLVSIQYSQNRMLSFQLSMPPSLF